MNRITTGSDYILSPIRCLAITRTSADILPIGPLGKGWFTLHWRQRGFEASQNTDNWNVCSMVCWGWQRRKHESSGLMALYEGNLRVPTDGFPSQSASNAARCEDTNMLLFMVANLWWGHLLCEYRITSKDCAVPWCRLKLTEFVLTRSNWDKNFNGWKWNINVESIVFLPGIFFSKFIVTSKFLLPILIFYKILCHLRVQYRSKAGLTINRISIVSFEGTSIFLLCK